MPDADALAHMRVQADGFADRPTFALLVMCGEGTSAEAELRSIDSIERQAYSNWEVGRALDTTAARNAFANESKADFLIVLDAGDELAPHALFEIASCLSSNPAADIVYSDEDCLGSDGPVDPTFKPGWSPEYLLARNYIGQLLAIRRAMLTAAGGYRPDLVAAHSYDVVLRLVAAGARIAHVPKVLFHRRAPRTIERGVRDAAEQRALEDFCRFSGRDAEVVEGAAPGLWRVRTRIAGAPRVTIVIPTDAREGPTLAGPQVLAVQCIKSVVERTAYRHFDILIVDNGTFPTAATDVLRSIPHERISYRADGPFNFSKIVNFAVSRTSSEYVLLLNDDIEVINADWLTAMLEHAQNPAIGAVGAKLFYPDGRLQHVGVATGVSGIAAHLLHQHPGGTAGCGQIAFAVRNCTAVTAACMLLRRAVFDEVKGMDDRLAVDFNDVDFCLKIRAAGYRIVFTPHARLYHHESASFGSRVQHPRDADQMREMWGATLDRDPYYNPNFSREVPDCRLAPIRRPV